MTGTLRYAEPAELTTEASAIVVIVEHSGVPITARIIESRVMTNPGQIPIAFELPYTAHEIDAEALYTVSAAIVDGSRLWTTDGGTRVITYGNPTTDVPLDLIYRPDLLKGQVTGEITGPGVTLAGSGFAAAVLFDATSNEAVGMTVEPAPTGVPIDFSVPFDPGEIDDAADYVVVAGIVEGDNRWANRDGVPVITNGNPLTGIVVPVSAVEPSPSPSAPPAVEEGGTGLSPLAIIVLLLILGAIVAAAVWYVRSRNATPPEDGGIPGAVEPEEPVEAADVPPAESAPPVETEPPVEPEPGAEPPIQAEPEPAAEPEPPMEPDPGDDRPPSPAA